MRVEVTNEGGSYALTAAVLVYTNLERGHAMATKHAVLRDDETLRIEPGSPLTLPDYNNLVAALPPKDQPRMQWHDSRVLASGVGRLLWWEPPTTRAMFFAKSWTGNKTFDASGTCATPGLVFMAQFEPVALYVFAFRGAARPSPSTRLCQAPFFNVWSRGQVCVGNATLPREDQQSSPDAWVQSFFGSHFTHPNFSQKDRLIKGHEPHEFWQQHLASGRPSFPEEVLVDLNLQVEDLLQVDYQRRLSAVERAAGEF